MTRFEKWIEQHNSKVDLVCKADFRWFCEDAHKGRCILYPVCEKYKFANELGKEFIDEAEAYLAEMANFELDSKELDKVAGGKAGELCWTNCIPDSWK